MSSIISLKVQTHQGFVMVSAKPFTIDGSQDQFAVYRSVGLASKWTASHVETGFAIAQGRTSQEATKEAREKWVRTPESIRQRALSGARKIIAEREGA